MTQNQSGLVKLAKSASFVLVGTIFGHVVALFGEILVARSLRPTVYGDISLAYTIVSSSASLALLGIHQGVTRLFSSNNSERYRIHLIQAGYLLVIAASVSASILLYMGRHLLANLMEVETLDKLLILFLPYLLLYPVAEMGYSVLRAQKRTLPAIMSKQIAGRAISFFSLVFLLFAGFEFQGAIAFWVLLPLVTAVAVCTVLFRDVDLLTVVNRSPSKEVFLDLGSFSWPIAIGSMVFIFLTHVDILMIGYFTASVQVGYYRAVVPLQNVSTFALAAFTFLFLPLATEQYSKNEGLNNLFTISTKWILLISLPPVLVFFLFSPSVVEVLFGPEYLPAAPALSVLVFGSFLRAVSGLNGDVVKAINKPRIELYSGLIGLFINIFLNILLIPIYGIVGAAIATALGYSVYNGIELGWIYRLTDSSPFSINIFKLIISMTTIASIVAVVTPSELNLGHLIGIGIFFVLIELIVLVMTKSVDEADIDVLIDVEDRIGFNLGPVRRLLNRGL